MQDIKLETKVMSEEDAKAVCEWKYENEYAVYNFSPWEEVCKAGWDLSNAEKRDKSYVAVYKDNELFGFYNIMYREDHIELGVGMKPEMCGKHYGKTFMNLAIQTTEKRYPNMPIVLLVRPFNKRAIRLYENCGFKIVGQYYESTFITPGEMLIMRKETAEDAQGF